MNEFISKKQTNKKQQLFFTDNDTKITDEKDIANTFYNYFTNRTVHYTRDLIQR